MQEIGSYLIIDPEICHAQLIFKGTRIPVDTVLSYLARGYSVDQLVQNWPELTPVAVAEAVNLAANSLQARYAPGQYATPVVATA
jgi:uncharacterized protein (DUF433 family)